MVRLIGSCWITSVNIDLGDIFWIKALPNLNPYISKRSRDFCLVASLVVLLFSEVGKVKLIPNYLLQLII